MRVKLKASVGIKTPRGGIDFGTVRWIEGDKMMLSSAEHLERGMTCELKMELHGAGGWIYTSAYVLKASSYQSNQNTKAVVQLLDLSVRDQDRLQTFIDLQRNQGQPSRRLPSGISVAGSAPAPSSSGAIPLRDPLYNLSEDGRRLTVRWHNTKIYRRDWALHLAHGRLPVSCTAPRRKTFMLRLVMPNGFVATFPAEIAAQSNMGWQARFLIPMALRDRMQRIAEVAARRVAK